MKYRHSILVLSLFLLSGCLSPVKTEPPASYVLNTVPRNVPLAHSNAGVLMVLPPDTRPIYNTTRMAYTNKPYQVQYFSENQWAETPSQMLQPLIIQTLINTRQFKSVVAPPYIGAYQYVLSTQIVRFDQDFMCKPHTFTLVVRANLNRMSTNQLIAAKEYVVRVPIRNQSPYSGVVAANAASRQFLQDIATFVVDKV